MYDSAVLTVRGSAAARSLGLSNNLTTVEDSVDGLTAKVSCGILQESYPGTKMIV